LKILGGSFTVETSEQLRLLMQTITIEEAGTIAAKYVKENSGATDTIFNWLQEKRLFTNA
jgi:hypothetical protein